MNGKGRGAEWLTKRALFAALAVVMGYVESLVPLPFPVPGIKLGIANIVTVCAAELISFPAAALISLIRVFIISFLFGNFTSLLYSLAGMALSLLMMRILWNRRPFSLAGISAGGGAAHGIGQIAAASALMQSPALVSYLPVLIISGAVCGMINGFLSIRIVSVLRRSALFRDAGERAPAHTEESKENKARDGAAE